MEWSSGAGARSARSPRSRSPRALEPRSHACGFDKTTMHVVYWGAGARRDGWNLDQPGCTPRLCPTCGDLQDAWRGRFDNAQVTLRMCAAEGGFKPYIASFLLLSTGACVSYDLHRFYKWCVRAGKKVLTERLVLGTMLEVHRGSRPTTTDRGVCVSNEPQCWHHFLSHACEAMQKKAREQGGLVGVLVLDQRGKELQVRHMCHDHAPNVFTHFLIMVGGPDGIPEAVTPQIRVIVHHGRRMPVAALSGGPCISFLTAYHFL